MRISLGAGLFCKGLGSLLLAAALLMTGCGGQGAGSAGTGSTSGGAGSKAVSAVPQVAPAVAFPDPASYSEARAAEGLSPYSRWGLVGADGKWVLAPKYAAVLAAYADGLVLVSEEKGSGIALTQKYGMVDRKGNPVIEAKYDQLFRSDDHFLFRVDKQMGMLDLHGKEVVPAEFAELAHFRQGLAAATKEGALYGYIDKTGKWVIAPAFTAAHSFTPDGTAWAKGKGSDGTPLYGRIDKSGKWVVQPKFAEISGTAAKLPGGAWGYVDKAGAWTIEPQFQEADFFSNGYAVASKDGKLFGLIDEKGKWLVEPKYIQAYSFTNMGVAAGQLPGGAWEFFGKNTKPIAAAQGATYDAMLFIDNADSKEVMVLAREDGKMAVMNKKGELIVPFSPAEATAPYQVTDSYFYVDNDNQRIRFVKKGFLKLFDFSGKEIVVEKAPAA